MEDVKKVLLTKSKRSKIEQHRKFTSLLCITLIVLVVLSIFYFVANKGLATFFTDRTNVFDFPFGADWNPSQIGTDGKPMVGASPVIAGSFTMTFLSTIVAIPFAIGAAVFVTKISPKNGAKILQPVIELLVGIPSVVCGFISLSVIVPFVRSTFSGTGFSILAGTFVLFVMILPTVTTMTVDASKAVPRHYWETLLALGATRQQAIYKVVLRTAVSGILTIAVFSMVRAFGGALAIQVVIGNVALIPTGLTAPASTLTSILTVGIGSTIMGAIEDDVLWSLVLILLLMSLFFNIATHMIGKKGELK